MRRLAPLAVLIAAGCATAPPVQQPPPAGPVRPPAGGAALIGLTAAELIQRFGNPALQVKEGVGLKLQFRGPTCVLDAYLYPAAGPGPEQVTHVEARLPSGVDTDRLACAATLQRG